MSKVLIIGLFIALAITSINCEEATSTNEDIKQMEQCLKEIKPPCGANDAACALELVKVNGCIAEKCMSGSEIQDKSGYLDCIASCKSNNPDVQSYLDGFNDCVYASILSYTCMLFAFIALFF